ncbi:cupin domain-containing protein [Tomitella gaofuii]|uniref:cupin domain-containing protein n=1 Tax=Tomitella gaofuii TaxID=2760083 RepID=UPI0015F7BEB9|nr:cupin domain-containing protein [Tomitella gaofuii]
MPVMAESSTVLVADGLGALAEQNPISAGRVSPHFTFDGDGFRIRHLAFDEGAVLAEHTAPLPIIVHVVEGAVDFAVDGDIHTLHTGAILHVAAGNPHQVTAHERARLIVTLVG